MDLASEALSLHAFAELADNLSNVSNVRLVLPPEETELGLFGSDADRAARNRLQGRWLARRCADWIEKAAEIRRTDRPVPQGAVVLRNGDGHPGQAVLGSFSFSTDGLGLAPGNPLNLIHASETPEESRRLSEWFDGQWSALAGDETAKVYAKLPGWFQVKTPLGNYNPDWAVLVDTDEGERLYFVVETKGSQFLSDLRSAENAKIAYGRAHFSALRVRESAARYEVATGVDELLATVDVSSAAPTGSGHDA